MKRYTKVKFHKFHSGCGGGLLQPEVVQSTGLSSRFPASSVLILGQEDAALGQNKYNYWLAEEGKTTGQGFTMQVDTCARTISGCQIKNRVWRIKIFDTNESENQ